MLSLLTDVVGHVCHAFADPRWVKILPAPTAKACGFWRDSMLSQWEVSAYRPLGRPAKAWHTGVFVVTIEFGGNLIMMRSAFVWVFGISILAAPRSMAESKTAGPIAQALERGLPIVQKAAAN